MRRDLRRDEEYQAMGHDYPSYDDEERAAYHHRQQKVEADQSAVHRAIFWMARLLLAPACAILMLVVGVAQWYEYVTLEHLNVSEYVVASYLIFFGLLFLLCELTDLGIRTYFGLLFTYTGRGLAYIFCGSLCFGMASERFWPLGPAVGFSLLGVGVVLILVGWIFVDLPPLNPWCCSFSSGSAHEEDHREKARHYANDY